VDCEGTIKLLSVIMADLPELPGANCLRVEAGSSGRRGRCVHALIYGRVCGRGANKTSRLPPTTLVSGRRPCIADSGAFDGVVASSKLPEHPYQSHDQQRRDYER